MLNSAHMLQQNIQKLNAKTRFLAHVTVYIYTYIMYIHSLRKYFDVRELINWKQWINPLKTSSYCILFLKKPKIWLTVHILDWRYVVCLLRTRTPKLSGATLTGEIACENILHSALHFQKLLYQAFPPISHLIGCIRYAVHHSLLTPSKSLSWRFREIVCHGQKKLKRIQEIVRKVYHDKALMRKHI